MTPRQRLAITAFLVGMSLVALGFNAWLLHRMQQLQAHVVWTRPCVSGMTLAPGQQCTITIPVLPVPAGERT